MSFEEEYRELMAKPIEELKEDIFFRMDNFQNELWYGELKLYLTLGVCKPHKDHVIPLRKALKIMGYPSHECVRDGKVFVLPGEVPQRKAPEPEVRKHQARER